MAFSNSMWRRRENRRGLGPRTSPRWDGCMKSVSIGSMHGSLSRLRGEGPRAPFQRKNRRVKPRDTVRRYACKMRKCSIACCVCFGWEDLVNDSIQIERLLIWVQRLAEEDVLPWPDMGCRYKRPPGWIGCNESALRLYNGARSTAMRREINA